jgi:hypothetical protein
MIPILRQIDWLFDWEWQMGQNKNKKHSYFEYRVGGGGMGFQKWRATKEVANMMLDSQPSTLCTHPDPTELYILEHLQQHSVCDPAKIFLAKFNLC